MAIIGAVLLAVSSYHVLGPLLKNMAGSDSSRSSLSCSVAVPLQFATGLGFSLKQPVVLA